MFNENNEIGDRGYGRGLGLGRGLGRGQRWMSNAPIADARLVEPALLAFLKSKRYHGYGLIEKLADLGFSSINPSQIYRILRDYEELGLVQSDWDTISSQGPPKRVYTITPEGEIALKRAAASLIETANRIEILLTMIEPDD